MHILLLARHYPPEISGGARRPFLMTKALRKRGIRVTVVAPFANPDDPDFICVPHPVYGETPPEPLAAVNSGPQMTVRNRLRQWLLWPDPEIRWCRRAARQIIASRCKPDWLITTSPPEAAHVVGAQIASALEICWLAEFRDTWTEAPHRKILEASPLRALVERQIARQCLKRVSALTGVSEPVLREIRRYVAPGTPELKIGHFSITPSHSMKLPTSDLNLVHTGGFTLSDRRRPIKPLLTAITKAAQSRENLHLHLAGRLSEEEKEATAQISRFRVTLYGELALEEAQALQAGADALILYTPAQSHALPGKYAEYRFAQRPILYFGGGEWLSLADDPSLLTPLETGLTTLTKGEGVSYAKPFSADDAAGELAAFLSQIKTPK